ESDNEARTGQPRVRDVEGRRLRSLLREGRRAGGKGLRQLRRRLVAPGLPELELLGDRRVPGRLAGGALAPPRPRQARIDVHPRVLAPPALLVRPPRERRGGL